MPEREHGVVAVEPMYIPPQMVETLYEERAARADAELAEDKARLQDLAPTVTIDVELASGAVLDVILQRAAEHDLVIIGSHGLTGAARFLLGSTAEKVSRKAPCPVLVTPTDDRADERLPRFERIMVGIDYSAFSPAAINIAAHLVAIDGALDLVHVWTPPFVSPVQLNIGGVASDLNTALDTGRTAQIQQLSAFVDSRGAAVPENVRIESYLAVGSATDGLLERAEQTHPSLIVLGAHGRDTLTEKVLGTVADRVLRHAESPVLLVPEAARQRWGDA